MYAQFVDDAEWQPNAAEHAACLQAQEQARAQLVAEHEQRAAAAAAEHAAALQQLQQQAAEQRLAGEAAQAAWAAAQSSLEQAVSDATAQLEAAQQQSQVRPGACFVMDGWQHWQHFPLTGSNNFNAMSCGMHTAKLAGFLS